jgi:primosomal protein N' (replication factor Y)
MISRCPHCGSYNIKRIGYGTESIEEEISHTIPNARVIRYDYDTTHRKNEHTKLLKAFENQEGNILLGTQMIAKGLDFENVTFVGVLMADTTLTIPDYRSSERTFELLAQVAGRSGRGKKEGQVIIQTFNPDHYAITCAAHHDYAGFYKQEMAYRRTADYPPYCHLVAIIVMGENEYETKQAAEEIKRSLTNLHARLRILGPSEASIYKMKDVYRERLLVKYRHDGKQLHQLLVDKVKQYNVKSKAKVRVVCDYHPYTQL